MMAHKITESAVARIKREEGWSSTVYTCAGGAATVAYGITNADAALIGAKITPGLKVDKETGDRWLRLVLEKKYGPAVDRWDAVYHWSPEEFEALLSFQYNLGKIDALTANGTRSRQEIADKLLEYNKAGGKVNAGLKERRKRERELFVSGWNRHDMDTLSFGAKGQQVRVLQRLIGGCAIDGDFGQETKAALVAWQRAHGLDADGVCGPLTWAVLV